MDPLLGNKRIVGHREIRDNLMQIVAAERVTHAYLFAGPPGTGKKALALAFAEYVQGIDNLSGLGAEKKSRKSSWYTHPDVHLFLPLPSHVSKTELRSRIEMLAKDPYEIVDFALRPSLSQEEIGRNRVARYGIDYFKDDIKPVAYLKPNEGKFNIIILSNVEKMGIEATNAFLKLLEEPPPQVMFLLTTDNVDLLLPTIISRCQVLSCAPLKPEDIFEGLTRFDGIKDSDAQFLSRIAGGDYSMTRFFDSDTLRENREEAINFLRNSYISDAVKIIKTAADWNSRYNNEGIQGLITILEVFIRDLMVYRSSQSAEMLVNTDQEEAIRKFCLNLDDARLEEMLEVLHEMRGLIRQNVSVKYIFTVISLRFASLMRGRDPIIPKTSDWKHFPAFTGTSI